MTDQSRIQPATRPSSTNLSPEELGPGGLPAVTSISHVVLAPWKSGKQIQAEDLGQPSVRGFLGTMPGVLAVVEGHSISRTAEDGDHHGFIVTFATPQACDAYLNDPNHRPVAEAIGAAAELRPVKHGCQWVSRVQPGYAVLGWWSRSLGQVWIEPGSCAASNS